jgi:hypothetical protein
MRNTHALLAALCTLGLAATLCASAHAQNYPRLALHGRLYGNGFPLILGGTIQGPPNGPALDAYARYDELTIPASPVSEYRPDIAQELRDRNPDIRLIAYVIGEHIWPGPSSPDSLVDYQTRYRRLVRDLDGHLYNRKNGAHYTPANVNLAKRTSGRYVVAEGLADLFHDVIVRSGVWDGIFIDQFCNSILWTETPSESIDFVRAGYSTKAAFDASWLTATDTLANRLRRLAGPNFVLVGNCAQGTKYASFNGWMRENFPYQNGGTWYENMYRDPGGYFTDEAKFRQPTHNYLFTAALSPTLPYNSNNLRKVRFGLGSAALGTGYNIFGPSDLDMLNYPFHHWWYDEYGVDLSTARSDSSMNHIGWLGLPTGPSHQMIWISNAADAVANPGFETDLSNWTFINNGIPATAQRDTTRSAVGGASLRVTALTMAPATWSVNLSVDGVVNLISGAAYSATFWARASRSTQFVLATEPLTGGATAARTVAVDTTWRQYQIALNPSAGGNSKLKFFLGQMQAELWLDDVHFQAGASTIYRRDFQNGIVLVNPATTSMTVPLGRQFRKILGMHDTALNNGAFVTQVTVLPSDAIFLIGEDTMPPSTVLDLRPSPQ